MLVQRRYILQQEQQLQPSNDTFITKLLYSEADNLQILEIWASNM